MGELPIDQMLTRARAVLADEADVAVAVSAVRIGAGALERRTAATSRLMCFECNRRII